MASPSTTSLSRPRRLIGVLEAGPVERRVKDAACADRLVDGRRTDARPDDHERHVHRRLVEQMAVLRFAVIAETLAVIAGDDRSRRPVPRASKACVRRPSCSSIGGDFAEVGLWRSGCGIAPAGS